MNSYFLSLCRERKTGYYHYGCAASGYAWFQSRQDIMLGQRDMRYSHYFCGCFCSVLTKGRKELEGITNSGFIGKPIKYAHLAKNIGQLLSEFLIC
jgi:hypothetical protein